MRGDRVPAMSARSRDPCGIDNYGRRMEQKTASITRQKDTQGAGAECPLANRAAVTIASLQYSQRICPAVARNVKHITCWKIYINMDENAYTAAIKEQHRMYY